ncbi:MAG: ATP-binding protein [Phycisphaerales bacterium]
MEKAPRGRGSRRVARAGARPAPPTLSADPAGEPGASRASVARAIGTTTGLVHELSNLIDGAGRSLGTLLRQMGAREGPRGARRQAAESGTGAALDLHEQTRRLESIKAAIDQMSRLVHEARNASSGARPSRAGRPSARPDLRLDEAVRLGVEILQPLAREHAIRLTARVDAALASEPAGPAYALVMNGVRNSIESIAARPPREVSPDGAASAGGVIEVEARIDEPAHVLLEIRDNGVGLPARARERGRLFTPGFSTKADGSGVGLAFCRELTSEHGGWVKLEPRRDGPGAILRARFPSRRAGRQPGQGRHAA